jgi:hypothetical protein
MFMPAVLLAPSAISRLCSTQINRVTLLTDAVISMHGANPELTPSHALGTHDDVNVRGYLQLKTAASHRNNPIATALMPWQHKHRPILIASI